MKKIIYISFLLLTQFIYSAIQSQLPVTEVLLLGTIHTGNKKFDHKTLYELLEKMQPDIILQEHSDPYQRVGGLKTATFLKIAKPSIEQLALQKYSKKYSEVLILPYDTSFVSRKQYVKDKAETDIRLFEQMNAAKMIREDSLGYADFANQYNDYFDLINQSTLERLNQPDLMETSRKLYGSKETLIVPLAKKYLSDSLLVQSFQEDLHFWNVRNDFMARKISSYITQYPGKKIIVLTGLNHKYFLHDRLLEEKLLHFRFIQLDIR